MNEQKPHINTEYHERRTLKTDLEKHPRIKKTTVGALAAVCLVGTAALIEGHTRPDFSEETTTVTIMPGETLTDAIDHIKDIDGVDKNRALSYIDDLPGNEDLPPASELQPGTEVVIPVAVKD
jgi:hypothetical protein